MAVRQRKHKRLTKKDVYEIVESETPNAILHIRNVECDIDANPEVYSDDDLNMLTEIVDRMSKDIWIDKTYVSYEKNRFRNAFIVEDKWYDFIKLMSISTMQKLDRRGCKAIRDALTTIAVVYLYQVAERYGFNTEDIEIHISEQAKIKAELFRDNRTTWNF